MNNEIVLIISLILCAILLIGAFYKLGKNVAYTRVMNEICRLGDILVKDDTLNNTEKGAAYMEGISDVADYIARENKLIPKER